MIPYKPRTYLVRCKCGLEWHYTPEGDPLYLQDIMRRCICGEKGEMVREVAANGK